MPDVYRYDTLPIELRTQVLRILERALDWGDAHGDSFRRVHDLEQLVAEEYGQLELPGPGQSQYETVAMFVRSASTPTEKVLDMTRPGR